MLANMLAGAAGVGLVEPACSSRRGQAKSKPKKKQVLIFLLNGGLSQLESFDPKPNTDTGGPFRSIPTSVPGTHFCELMPHTATIADKLAVVRSVYAENVPGSHGGAREYVVTGPAAAARSVSVDGAGLLQAAGQATANCRATFTSLRAAGARGRMRRFSVRGTPRWSSAADARR